MKISLYNTLSRAKEEFTPLNASSIGMYVCGPTVYDRAHIGNARAVIVFDVLFRLLRYAYGQDAVKYVRNITDVDDKIIIAARDNNEEISTLTERTTRFFHEDMGYLNALPPTAEPRATTHISQMVAMISRLISRGHAYAAEGHVLYNITTNPEYGKLSRRSQDEMIAGARVEVAPYKQNAGDFILWKPSDASEPGWDSPWGYGRPGWHIECSAMSFEHLGKNFDIHGGGADLMFPHHENEIAQSSCADDNASFARYWVHNGFLTVNGEKMSKSLGNFITVNDLREQGVRGEVIRLALLSTHYRKPLDWNEKLLSDSKKTMDVFYKALAGGEISGSDADLSVLGDDLNTPGLIASLHDYAKSGNTKALKTAGNLLGILQHSPEDWLKEEGVNIPQQLITQVEEIIEARKAAKLAKNYAEADSLRKAAESLGFLLEDKPGGITEWRRA